MHGEKAIGIEALLAFCFFVVVVIALEVTSAAVNDDVDVVIGTNAVSVALSALLMSFVITMYTAVHYRHKRKASLPPMSTTHRWLYGGAWFILFLITMGAALGALISGERISSASNREGAVIALSVISAISALAAGIMVCWAYLTPHTTGTDSTSPTKQPLRSRRSQGL